VTLPFAFEAKTRPSAEKNYRGSEKQQSKSEIGGGGKEREETKNVCDLVVAGGEISIYWGGRMRDLRKQYHQLGHAKKGNVLSKLRVERGP